MLNFGPSLIKPARWPLQPHLTAAPELWRDHAFMSPFWDAKGTDVGGRSLTVNSNPLLVLDERGYCISFDGTDDYFEIPGSTSWLQDKFTVAFWSKIASGDDGVDQRAIASWVDGSGQDEGFFVVWMDADGAGKGWRSQIKSSDGNTIGTVGSADASNLITDQWQSIVCVYDRSTYKIYVDGVLIGSQAASSAVGELVSLIRIGNLEGVGQFFKGKIDIPVIQTRPWTEVEVKQYHDDPFAMLRPGPQAIPMLFGGAGATGTVSVPVSSSTHTHVATSPSLSPTAQSLPNDVIHSHVLSEPSISSDSSTLPTNSAHNHTTTEPTLSITVDGSVAPTSSVHQHNSTSPSITSAAYLYVLNSIHNHTATEPSLAASTLAVFPYSRTHTHLVSSPNILANIPVKYTKVRRPPRKHYPGTIWR